MMTTIGVFLISGGPTLAMLLFLLQPRAHLLVLSIFGAFAWNLSMIIAGCIWLAVVPLKRVFPWCLFLAVTSQELMRFVLFKLFAFMSRKGDGIEAFLRVGVRNEILSGLSIGVGYGFMSSMINFYSMVVDNFSSRTAVYNDTCPINFIVISASFALAFSVLHVCLGIIVWPAYSQEVWWPAVILSYFLHLGISELTLLNRVEGKCIVALGVIYGLLAVVIVITFILSRSRFKKEQES